MQAHITISLKEGVLDPQAKAIHHAIDSLGFNQVSQVIVHKHITLELDSSSPEQASQIAEQIAHDLLANPVIEDYEVQIKA